MARVTTTHSGWTSFHSAMNTLRVTRKQCSWAYKSSKRGLEGQGPHLREAAGCRSTSLRLSSLLCSPIEQLPRGRELGARAAAPAGMSVYVCVPVCVCAHACVCGGCGQHRHTLKALSCFVTAPPPRSLLPPSLTPQDGAAATATRTATRQAPSGRFIRSNHRLRDCPRPSLWGAMAARRGW